MKQNFCRKTFFNYTVCKGDFFSSEMQKVLDHPDTFLNDKNTKILQNNFKSKIGVIFIDGKKIVIKRHNYKSRWHKFKRFFRRTRASRNWYFSKLLLSHGISVPQPVAFVETRIGPLRLESYFMYEYVDGITGDEYFKKNADVSEKIEGAINHIVNLLSKIKELQLIHGDIRISNLIFKNGKIWLLDFDDMRLIRWYKPLRVKIRDIRGLKKDIHYNVPEHIKKQFIEELDRL